MNDIGKASAISFKALGGGGINAGVVIGGKMEPINFNGGVGKDITKDMDAAIQTHLVGGKFTGLEQFSTIQTEISDPILVKDSLVTRLRDMAKGMNVIQTR